MNTKIPTCKTFKVTSRHPYYETLYMIAASDIADPGYFIFSKNSHVTALIITAS
jgi:hypothetical protein